MKNIVFCADGTWNGTNVDEDHDGVPDVTNVLKLFHLLGGDTTLESRRLQDEAEKVLSQDGKVIQVAKYLHGVGDSDNPLMRLLGGVFGSGVIARIVRGYTFISRNYEDGDRIFIVGFSRGAYTARALGGMISGVGLLSKSSVDLSDKELAYSLGVGAWRMYREKAKDRQVDQSIKQALADLISSMPGYARIPLRSDQLRPASIQAIAVWDTVGSLGLPSFDGDGKMIDAFRFADDLLSANVQTGIHAVSWHERRANFQPTLWQRRDGIKQYLFGGAHADVGGGYPETESALSNIALKWMIDELGPLNMQFKEFPTSWSGSELANIHKPWTSGIFAKLPHAERSWPDVCGLIDHPSLVARKKALGADM
jgi:uncharacterized protein (DUF2235 family)